MGDDYSEYHKRIRNFGELNRAIFFAAIQGDVKEVEALLDRGAGTNGTYTREGSNRQESILGAAVKEDRPEVAELLIKRGANVNMICPDGRTAIMIAARHGHADMVSLLIKSGADVNVTFDNNTLFDMAEKAPQQPRETIAALLEGYSDEGLRKAFRDAARRGNLKLLETIAAKKDFDVDCADHHGNSALHMIVENLRDILGPHLPIAKLVALGANIDAENNMRETPLSLLMMKPTPSPAAVGALIAGGADILRENLAGMTNYEAAQHSGSPAVQQLFEAAYHKRVTAEIDKVYEGATDDMRVKPIRLKKPAGNSPK